MTFIHQHKPKEVDVAEETAKPVTMPVAPSAHEILKAADAALNAVATDRDARFDPKRQAALHARAAIAGKRYAASKQTELQTCACGKRAALVCYPV